MKKPTVYLEKPPSNLWICLGCTTFISMKHAKLRWLVGTIGMFAFCSKCRAWRVRPINKSTLREIMPNREINFTRPYDGMTLNDAVTLETNKLLHKPIRQLRNAIKDSVVDRLVYEDQNTRRYPYTCSRLMRFNIDESGGFQRERFSWNGKCGLCNHSLKGLIGPIHKLTCGHYFHNTCMIHRYRNFNPYLCCSLCHTSALTEQICSNIEIDHLHIPLRHT